MNEKQHWNEEKLQSIQMGESKAPRASLDQNTTFGTSKNPEGFVQTWKEASHMWRWRAVLCLFMSLLLAMMQPSGNALYRAWGFGDGFESFAAADNSGLMAGSIDDDEGDGDDFGLTVAANDEYVDVVNVTYGNGAHFFPDWTYAPKISEWYYGVGTNPDHDDNIIWSSAQSGNTWAQRNSSATGGYATIHPTEGLAGKGTLVSTSGGTVTTDYVDSNFGPNNSVPHTPFWYMGYSLARWTAPVMSNLASKEAKGEDSSGQLKYVLAPYAKGIENSTTHTLYHTTLSATEGTGTPAKYPSVIATQNDDGHTYVDQFYYGDWRETQDYSVSLVLPATDDDGEYTGAFEPIEVENPPSYSWDSTVTPQSIYESSAVAAAHEYDRFFSTFDVSWELYIEGTTPTGVVVPDGGILFGDLVNPNKIADAKYDPRYEDTIYSSTNLGKNPTPATVYLAPTLAISYYVNGGKSTDGVATSVSIPLNTSSRVRDVGGRTYIYEPYVTVANEPTLAAWKTVKSNTDVGFSPQEGKKFVGWSTTPTGSVTYSLSDIANGAQITSDGILQSSINLYAVWEDDDGKVTLSYNKNGHGQDADVPADEKDEPGFTAHNGTEPEMTDENYTFGGWYKDPACTDGNKWNFATGTVQNNMTLYAKWTPKQYTITFDMGGHGTQIAPKTLDYDSAIGAVADPSESGWTFDGWYEEDTYDTEVTNIATCKVTGNKTYYAKWTEEAPETYTVKFMTKSSASSDYSEFDSVDVVQGQVITAAAAPTPSTLNGYSFMGWSTSQNYPTSGKLWNLSTDPVPANMSLYAYYVADNAKFTVKFYGYDAAENWRLLGTQEVEAGKPVGSITAYSAPTVGEESFYGWAKSTIVSYGPESNATLWDIANTPVTGNMNLCEVWGDPDSPDEFITITFEVAQGNDVAASDVQGAPDSLSRAVPAIIDAPSIEPTTTTGWTFAGWYTTAERTDLFDFANTSMTENTTIYAKWNAPEGPVSTTYEVKFMDKTTVNGAYSLKKSIDVDKNQVVTTAAAPSSNTIDNYKFEGWYTGENGTGTKWDLTMTPVTASTTLYAHYISSSTKYIVKFYGYDAAENWRLLGTQEVEAGKPVGSITAYSAPTVGEDSFYGWAKSTIVSFGPESNATLWDIANTPVTGNMNLCEVWGDPDSPDEFITITFEVAQGNDVAAGDVENPPASLSRAVPATIEAPATVPTTSTGWAFSGWYTTAERTTLFDFANTEMTSDTTIYAKWVPDPSSQATVTFDLQGAGSPQPNSQKVTKGSGKVTSPTAPTASNLTFGGWYTDSACTQAWNFNSTVSDDMTLYAKWTAAITFDKNGHGSSDPGTVNVLYNTTMLAGSIPADPTDNDYTFDGWFTAASGGSQVDLSTYTFTRNRTLYAHWTQKVKYNVTFMANGHGEAPATQQVIDGETANNPGTLTAEDGYDHDGKWYTSSACNPNDVFDFTTPITQATTLYAKWTPHAYTITYSGIDGATVNPANKTTYKVTESNFTLTNPTKTNYVFTGWSGTGLTGENNMTVTVDTSTKQNLTFTAHWEQSKFTVKYNLNGHGSAIADEEYAQGGKITKPSDPVAEGYAFKGWFKEAELTNEWNFSTDTVNNNPTTLYAKWLEVHTVTFNSKGGSAVASQKVENGATATKPANPTMEHYDFDGWYTTEALDYPVVFSDPITKDVTYYAKWKPKKYTVTFDTGGGSPVPDAQSVEYGSTATAPTVSPTKSGGFTFDAWYKDGAAYDFSTPVEGDITLTAHYTSDEYTITLALGKGTIDSSPTKVMTTTAVFGDKTNTLGWAAALASVSLPAGYVAYSEQTPGTWSPANPMTALNIEGNETYTWTPQLNAYDVNVVVVGSTSTGDNINYTIKDVPYGTEYKDIKYTGSGATRTYSETGTAISVSGLTPDADHRDSGQWSNSINSNTWETLAESAGSKVTGNVTLTYTFNDALRGVTLKVVGGTFRGAYETVISSNVEDGTHANTLITQAMINEIVPDNAAQYTVTGGTWDVNPLDEETLVSGTTVYTYTLATRKYDVAVTPANAKTTNTITITGVPYGTAYSAIKYTGSGNTRTYSDSGTALSGTLFEAATGYVAPGTWSGDGIVSPAASATPPSDVTVAGATALTYTFEPSTYQVTVTVTGGVLGGKTSYTITNVPYGTAYDAIAFNPTAISANTYAFSASGTTLASLTPQATTTGSTPYVEGTGRWNGGGMTSATALDGTKTVTAATNLTYDFKRLYKVTFHMNTGGTWSDGSTADITVNVTAGDTLPAANVPTGMKATVGYYKGNDQTAVSGSWNTTPDTSNAVEADVTYNYTFKKVNTITYSIVNGKWSDSTSADKTEYVFAGDKLANVPTGARLTEGFAATGTWTATTPQQGITQPSGDTTYTLTFAAQSASYRVEYYIQKVNAASNTVPALTGADSAVFESAGSLAPTKTYTQYNNTAVKAGDTVKFDAADIVDITGFTPYVTKNPSANDELTLDGTEDHDVYKVYYTRNKVTLSYRFTNQAGDTAVPTTAQVPDSVDYYVGATYTVDTTQPAIAAGSNGKYTFSGWGEEGDQTMPATAKELTGTWSAGTVTIVYVNNDSTGGSLANQGTQSGQYSNKPFVEQTVTLGDTVVAPVATPVGNKVLRWTSDEAATTIASIPATATDSIVLYANWVNPIAISYSPDADGVGTFVARSKQLELSQSSTSTVDVVPAFADMPVTEGHESETPATSHKKGYTFAGWIWDGQATPMVTPTPVGSVTDTSYAFVAVYNALNHDVYFDNTDKPSNTTTTNTYASGADSASTKIGTVATGSSSITLPTASQVKADGYSVEYEIYVEGTKVDTLEAGQVLTIKPAYFNAASSESAAVTIKAAYSQEKYGVTYSWSPSTIGVDEPSPLTEVAFGTKVTLPSVTATVAGYKFTGWSTPDATISDGKFTMPAHNVSVLGTWAKKNFKVNWVVADGYGGEVTLNTAVATSSAEFGTAGSTFITPTATTKDGAAINNANGKYTSIAWAVDDVALDEYVVPAASGEAVDTYDGVITVVGTPEAAANYTITINVVGGKAWYDGDDYTTIKFGPTVGTGGVNIAKDISYGDDVATILSGLTVLPDTESGYSGNPTWQDGKNPLSTDTANAEKVTGNMTYTATFDLDTIPVTYKLSTATDAGLIQLSSTTQSVPYGSLVSGLTFPTLQDVGLGTLVGTKYDTELTWTPTPVGANAITSALEFTGTPKLKTYTVKLKLVGAEFKNPEGTQSVVLNGGNPYEYGTPAATITEAINALTVVDNVEVYQGRSEKGVLNKTVSDVTGDVEYIMTYPKQYTVTFEVVNGAWTHGVDGAATSGSSPISVTVTAGQKLGEVVVSDSPLKTLVLPEASAATGFESGAWRGTVPTLNTTVDQNTTFTWAAQPKVSGYTIRRHYQNVEVDPALTYTAGDYEYDSSMDIVVEVEGVSSISLADIDAANKVPGKAGFKNSPVTYKTEQNPGYVESGATTALEGDTAASNVIDLYFDRADVKYIYTITNPGFGPATVTGIPEETTVRYGTQLTTLAQPQFSDTTKQFTGWTYNDVDATTLLPMTLTNDITEFKGGWAVGTYNVVFKADREVDAGATVYPGDSVLSAAQTYTAENVAFNTYAGIVTPKPSNEAEYEFTYWTLSKDGGITTEQLGGKDIQFTEMAVAAYPITGSNYVFTAHFAKRTYTITYKNDSPYVNDIEQVEDVTVFTREYGQSIPLPGVNTSDQLPNDLSGHGGDVFGNPVLADGATGHRLVSSNGGWQWKTSDQGIGSTRPNETMTVQGDITFVPNVVASTFTVYFKNTEGSTMESVPSVTNLEYTDSVFKGINASKKPMNPEYTAGGKTFTGWRVSSTNVDNPNGATISPNANQIVSGIVMASNTTDEYYLFAQWENAAATVSFFPNLAASETPETLDAHVSDTPALPSATSFGFSNAGYTFAGWTKEKENSANDFAGTIYHAGTTEYTVLDSTNDVTANFLYAKWAPITYQVKWRDANGNVIQDNGVDVAQQFTYGVDGTLAIPASVTAAFINEAPVGWTLLGSTYVGGETIRDLTSTADDVLYMEPKFANRITLTYKAGNVGTDTVTGVPVSPDSQVANASGKATFTMPADPERAGYVFDGWSINGGETLLKDGDTVQLTENGTAVAQWSRGEIEYTIERYLQQGINGSYVKDTSFVPPANLKTTATMVGLPDGFDTTLAGYTLVTGSPTKLTTAVTPGGENTIKLYYNVNAYKVTYVYDGVAGAAVPPVTQSAEMAYGTDYTLEAVPNSTENAANWPDGYTTSDTEWVVTDSKGNSVTVNGSREVTVNDNLTAKLTFTKQSFTVTFNLTPHGTWADSTPSGTAKTETVGWGDTPTMTGIEPVAADGYEFVGWGTSASATTTVTPTAIPVKSNDVEYWALFKVQKTVTWAPGDHSYDSFAGATANFEELMPGDAIPAPTNIKLDINGNPRAEAGYVFAGWEYDGVTYNNVSAVLNALTVGDDDMTFVAQWDKVNLTATFNNGANAVNPTGKTEKTQKIGDTVTMPAAPEAQPGYEFGGWAGTIDGKDKTYQLNETFTMPGENVTLTAVWNSAKVNFTYLTEDTATSKGTINKSGETNVDAVNNNNTYTVKATPEPGYKFVNWTYNDGTNEVPVPVSWNDPSITNKNSRSYGLLTIHKNADGVYESGTYTAHFEPDSCSVTFVNSDSSKGTISVSYANNTDQRVAYQGNATTTKGLDAVAGQDRVNWQDASDDYSFGGWKYTVTPIGASDPVTVQMDPDEDPATVEIVGDTVFTATWTPKPAIVVYDGNGSNGGNMEDATGLQAGDPYALLPVGFTRTGYDPDGYNETANGEGQAYAPGASITLHAGINKVYVQWTPQERVIKYHANPSDGSPEPATYDDTVVFGADADVATIEETGFVPTVNGATPAGARTFKEWNTLPNGLGDTVSNTITVDGNTPSDLYAIWQDKTFTIRFNGNGATNASSVSMNEITGVQYKQTVTIPENVFKRTGYTFRGWSDGHNTPLFGADGNASSYTWPAGVYEDVITLSAQWRGDEPYYINVIFRDDTGKVVDDSMTTAKDDGQSVSATPMATHTEPTRAGAEFQGWTAKLKDRTTLLSKNATLKDIISTYYKVGNTYGLAEYWDPTANGGLGDFTEGHANGANVTVYLNELFEVSEYTVVFEPNNPLGYEDTTVTKMTNQVVPFASTTTQKRLKANTYNFPGYRFLGWQPAKNGTAPSAVQTSAQYSAIGTTHYDDEYDLKANGDLVNNNDTNLTVTLYAVWEALPNTVEYVLTYPGDGVADPSDATSLGTRTNVAWSDVITLPDGTTAPVSYPDEAYADYMFEGWYTAKNAASITTPSGVEVQAGTSKFNEVLRALAVTPAKNTAYPLKVYAKWSRNGAKVVYEKGTADSTKNLPSPQAHSIDSEGAVITLATNTMERKGYTPNGWLEGTTPRADGLGYQFLSTDAGKVVTLKPNFTPNKYTVNYQYNTIAGVDDAAITKATDGATAGTGNPISSYQNGTLNLQWNSANILPGNIEANNAKTDGYTFEGWYTRNPSDSSAKKVDASWTVEQLAVALDGSVALADDTDGRTFTLYAKWVPNTYTVNYSLGTNPNGTLLDGMLPAPKTNLKWTDTTDKNGNSIVLSSADIKREGYYEPEWYVDPGFTVKLSESGSTNLSVADIAQRWRMVSGNETAELPDTFVLYAKWREDTVRITFTVSDTVNGRLVSYNAGSGSANYPTGTTQVVYEIGANSGNVISVTGNVGTVTATDALPSIMPGVVDGSGYSLMGTWKRTDLPQVVSVPDEWVTGGAIAIPLTGNNTAHNSGAKFVSATYEAVLGATTNNQYTVSAIYQNLDGSWPENAEVADTVTRTGTVGAIVSPDSEQATFARTGFEYMAGATPSVQIEADGSTVVLLKYARVAHDVTFTYEWEGTPEVATPSAPDPLLNVRYGATITLPEAAEAPSGYKFDGWYKESGGKLTANPTMGDSDMTIVGKWVRTSYKVVFDTNIKDDDGVAVTADKANLTVLTVGSAGQPVEVAAGKLITDRLAGYKITLTDTDNEGGTYSLGTTGKPNSDIELEYSSISFAISWAYTMGDDPTVHETLDPTSVPINGDTTFRVVANNTPVVKYLVGEHGTFAMSSEAGTLFKPVIPTGSVTYSLGDYLYAGEKDTRGADVTANYNLPMGEPGWKFAGWKYTYIDGRSIEQGDNMDEPDVLNGGIRNLTLNSSITLEAQWEPAKSMLVFDLGDTTNAVPDWVSPEKNKTGEYPTFDGKAENLVTLPVASDVVRTGYTLTKWVYTDGTTTTEYAPGGTFQMPAKDKNQTTKLVAKYAEDTVELRYIPSPASEGSVTLTSERVGVWTGTVAGSSPAITAEGSTAIPNPGSELLKWAKNAPNGAIITAGVTGTTLVPQFGASGPIATKNEDGLYDPVLFYAVFQGKEYTVTFSSADTSMGVICDKSGTEHNPLSQQMRFGSYVDTSNMVLTPKLGYEASDGNYWYYTMKKVVGVDGEGVDITETVIGSTSDPASVKVEGDIDFVANFKEGDGAYTVIYETNSPESAFSSVKRKWSEGNLVAGKTPRYSGYTFDGWFAYVDDGTGSYVKTAVTDQTYGDLAKSQDVMSITIFAEWTVITDYALNFDVNSAEASDAIPVAAGQTQHNKLTGLRWTSAVNSGNTVDFQIKPPTWRGHTLLGWYSEPSGGAKVLDASYTGAGSTYSAIATACGAGDNPANVPTLYAQWETTKYTVHYRDVDGTELVNPAPQFGYDQRGIDDQAAPEAPEGKEWTGWVYYTADDTAHLSPIPVTSATTVKDILDVNGDDASNVAVYATWGDVFTYSTIYHLYSWDKDTNQWIENYEDSWYYRHYSELVHNATAPAGTKVNVETPAANAVPGYTYSAELTATWNNPVDYELTSSRVATFPEDVIPQTRFNEALFHVAFTTNEGYYVDYDMGDEETYTPYGYTHPATHYPTLERRTFTADHNIPMTTDELGRSIPATPQREGFSFVGWTNREIAEGDVVKGLAGVDAETDIPMTEADNLVVPDEETYYGDLAVTLDGNWYDPAVTNRTVTLFARWQEEIHAVMYGIADDTPAGVLEIRLTKDPDLAASYTSTGTLEETIGAATGDSFIDGERVSGGTIGATARVVKRGYEFGGWRVYSSDKPVGSGYDYYEIYGTGEGDTSVASIDTASVKNRINDTEMLSVASIGVSSEDAAPYTPNTVMTPGVTGDNDIFAGAGREEDSSASDVLYVATVKQRNLATVKFNPGNTDDVVYTGPGEREQPAGTYVGETPEDDVWGNNPGTLPSGETISREGYTFGGWIIPAGTKYVDDTGVERTVPEGGITVKPTDELATRIIVPEEGLTLEALWTQGTEPDPDNPNPDDPDNPDKPNPDDPDNPDKPNPDNPDKPDNPDPTNPDNQSGDNGSSSLKPSKVRGASGTDGAPQTGDALIAIAGGFAAMAVLAMFVLLFARRRNDKDEGR